MAEVRNNWVGYLDRNYQEIKNKVLNTLGEQVPEVTDHSESNILVIIIGIFAGIAEMLNYYIDNMARESFITTARKYSSVVKLTRLIDYRIKAKIPSSVDLNVLFKKVDNTDYVLPADIVIPIGTKFTTANNVEFLSVNDITVKGGSTSTVMPLRQKTPVVEQSLGLTSGDPDQVYTLGKDYVNDSIVLTVGGEPWFYKETLGRSKPTDRDFIVEVSGSKEAYIRFGDNINGAIPEAGQELIADYYTSLGSLGNVEANTIVNSITNFTTTFGIPKVVINNPLKAVAGTDFEDIERIRRSAPLSLRTLLRAVTDQDYEDIALLAPGVNKAKIFFSCGKFVYLYISPNGGGISSTSFLQDVELYFKNKKMVTTFVKALPVGESLIVINVNVTAKFRMDGIQTREDIKNTLLDAYSYEKSDINKPIRQSDLIALVDNLSKVDFLKLIYLSVVPYIRPNDNTSVELNTELSINIGSTVPNNWLIKFDGVYMKLFKNNHELTNLNIGQTYTDPDNTITITILAGAYIAGNEWTLKTLPVNNDIILDDYSIPVLKEENLTITVNEQLSI